ncbi:MAG: DUF2513 domain-containing protein [Chloroflexi bacterium]|nr:DUF2513 domain-containing protein [Chloroflexota bacterium]
MKRDMDLIRNILLMMEESSDPEYPNIQIDGYSSETISYHLMLLDEAGLIKALDASSASGMEWMPQRLTWQGHEFVEAARNENRWNKAKNIMAKSGGFVIEVMRTILIDLVKAQATAYLNP